MSPVESAILAALVMLLWPLQVLWVSHCGLTGLDGLNALPSLRELYAAYNQIDNLEPVAGKLSLGNASNLKNSVHHIILPDAESLCREVTKPPL